VIFGKRGKNAQERVDQAESWSGYATLAILAGILAEIGLLFIFPHDISEKELWSLVVANLAIGIGLAIEFWCILRSIAANRELKIESDAKLAEATQQAAQAQTQSAGSFAMAAEAQRQAAQLRKQAAEAGMRAAEAIERARKIELQLVLFRLPRRDMLAGKTDIVTERLKPFAGTEFDCGIGQGGEQADFWWDLQPAIMVAGWTHIAWQYPPTDFPLFIAQGPDRPVSGSVGAANVEIHLHPEHREKLLPAATALISALNEVGIAAREAGYNTHNINTGAIHILIGDKA
jgi:hypothetical protein